MATDPSTPINTLSRESLTVLITNNIMNNSVEFISDCETMETDSPIRKSNFQPISKKLFQSPMSDNSPQKSPFVRQVQKSKRAKKRKQMLVPDSAEKMRKVFVTECERDGPIRAGMRRKVLISLFHNKEYSMDCE